MSTIAKLYRVSRFILITGWRSTGVGGRFVPEAVDPGGVGLRRQEHPLGLGTNEVVDVHQHRVTLRIPDQA